MHNPNKSRIFAHRFEKRAQVAESVDALVSNTSGAIRAGSTPALGTKKEVKKPPFFTKTNNQYQIQFINSSLLCKMLSLNSVAIPVMVCN